MSDDPKVMVPPSIVVVTHTVFGAERTSFAVYLGRNAEGSYKLQFEQGRTVEVEPEAIKEFGLPSLPRLVECLNQIGSIQTAAIWKG